MGKCVFDGDMGRSVVILKNEVISDQVRDWGIPFDVGEGLIVVDEKGHCSRYECFGGAAAAEEC